jgi:hypothetical protein
MIIVIKKPATGGGSVIFDVAGTGAVMGGSSTISASHTITNGLTNTAVVAIVLVRGSSVTISGCTHNSNAMTEMWNVVNTTFSLNVRSAGFVIATGTDVNVSRTVLCTFNTTVGDGNALYTSSYSGVNQSTPYRTASTNTGLTDAGTATVTVANAVTGDVVVDGMFTYTTTPGTSSTTLRSSNSNLFGEQTSMATSTAASTGSQVMSYTSLPAGGNTWAIGAAPIRP